MTADEIICQVMEDSDDSDTEFEEAAPTQPTSSELTLALMTLTSLYSNSLTLTKIEADMIASQQIPLQMIIRNLFVAKVLTNEVARATSSYFHKSFLTQMTFFRAT